MAVPWRPLLLLMPPKAAFFVRPDDGPDEAPPAAAAACLPPGLLRAFDVDDDDEADARELAARWRDATFELERDESDGADLSIIVWLEVGFWSVVTFEVQSVSDCCYSFIYKKNVIVPHIARRRCRPHVRIATASRRRRRPHIRIGSEERSRIHCAVRRTIVLPAQLPRSSAHRGRLLELYGDLAQLRLDGFHLVEFAH